MSQKTIVLIVALVFSAVGTVAQPATNPPSQPNNAGSECRTVFCPKPGDDALTSVTKKCGLVAVMGMDNYHGPKDAIQPYVTSMINICVVHAMPESWPGASAMLKRGQELYREAYAINPDLPDPETDSGVFEKFRDGSRK
jgi:hypothetical protein